MPGAVWAIQKHHQRHSSSKPKKSVRLPLPILIPSEDASSLTKIVGVKGRLPQDGPLWHECYFELKPIKTQQILEKFFTSPTQLPAYTRKRAINRIPL